MRWADHAACIGEMKNVYKTLVGKPEGMRAFGRSMPRQEDNIKTDFKEMG